MVLTVVTSSVIGVKMKVMKMNKIVKEQKKTKKLQLQMWREHYGLSQRGLGEKCGVSQAAVSQWEDDPMRIKFKYILKIAESFGIEPSDMLQGLF